MTDSIWDFSIYYLRIYFSTMASCIFDAPLGRVSYSTSVGSSDPKPGITRGLDPIFGFFQFKALGIFSISGRVGFRPDFFFQLFSGQGLESSQIKFQLQLGLFQGLKNKFFQVNSRKSWKNPKQIRFTFLLSLLLLASPSGVAIEDNVGNGACQGQGLSRTGPVGLAGSIFDRPRLLQALSLTLSSFVTLEGLASTHAMGTF